MTKKPREGLELTRLLMVLSSISPLFILWAIRGSQAIPDCYLWSFCAVMVIFPNAVLGWCIHNAKDNELDKEFVVGKVEDVRGHLMYLLAMLLPFYADTLDSWRAGLATLIALCFVVIMFLYLNYHYINILLAVFGYNVFTLYPPDRVRLGGTAKYTLITKRDRIASGESIMAYRISGTVYLEDTDGT